MKLRLPLALLALASVALSFHRPAEALAAPAPRAGEWVVDGVHSSVVFRCKHLGISYFWGRFNEVSGDVVYDPRNPSASAITIVIPSESVDSNSEGRDRHLKSNDFLSVKEFPEIVFESTDVKRKESGLEVTGDLTFHGVTKSVVADAEVVGTVDTPRGSKAGFEASFEIDMRDFGIAFVESSPGAVGPEVKVIVSLECNAKE